MGDIAALLLNTLDSLTTGGDPPTFTRILGSSIWDTDYPCFSEVFIVVHLAFFAAFCVILVAVPFLFTFSKVMGPSKSAWAFHCLDFDLPKGVPFYLDAGFSCLVWTSRSRAKPLCSTSTERLCGYFISSFRFFNKAIGLRLWLGPVRVTSLDPLN